MDINYLFHRQQIETTRAESALSSCARMVHQQMADLYARRIDGYRERESRIGG